MKLVIRKSVILLMKFVIALIMLVTISVLFFTSFSTLMSDLNKYIALKEFNTELPRIIGWLFGGIMAKSVHAALLGMIVGAIVGVIKKKPLIKRSAAIGVVIVMVTKGIATWALIGSLIGQSIAKEQTAIIVGGIIGIMIAIAITKKAWNIAAKTASQKKERAQETSALPSNS